jgi:glutaminyl-peptide cyclotransferase
MLELRITIVKYFIALLCLCVANLVNGQVEALNYQVIAERSHKTSLFTQGLFVNKGMFYESSGLYGKSLLVAYPVIEPTSTWAKLSAPFTKKQVLTEGYFAEGITLLNNKVYQLTWHEETLLVYDATTLIPLKSLKYTGEGWGLTTDGKQFIRSDGSDTLFFHHAENFSIEKKIRVRLNQQAITQLNELEYVDGFIWANIWHDKRILKIDSTTGQVVGVMDLTAIIHSLNLKDSESVLNGIAYDTEKKAMWVTGKQWPKMFLLKIN